MKPDERDIFWGDDGEKVTFSSLLEFKKKKEKEERDMKKKEEERLFKEQLEKMIERDNEKNNREMKKQFERLTKMMTPLKTKFKSDDKEDEIDNDDDDDESDDDDVDDEDKPNKKRLKTKKDSSKSKHAGKRTGKKERRDGQKNRKRTNERSKEGMGGIYSSLGEKNHFDAIEHLRHENWILQQKNLEIERLLLQEQNLKLEDRRSKGFSVASRELGFNDVSPESFDVVTPQKPSSFARFSSSPFRVPKLPLRSSSRTPSGSETFNGKLGTSVLSEHDGSDGGESDVDDVLGVDDDGNFSFKLAFENFDSSIPVGFDSNEIKTDPMRKKEYLDDMVIRLEKALRTNRSRGTTANQLNVLLVLAGVDPKLFKGKKKMEKIRVLANHMVETTIEAL